MDLFTASSRGDVPYGRLYTSNYVIDETVTFLLRVAGPRVAVETLGRMRTSPNPRVLRVTDEVESAADTVFSRHASSRVSYTDCTTKVLMERESIDAAFSFDRDIEVLGLARVP